MARLNLIIRAFDPEELQLLADIVDREHKQSIEEGVELSAEFHELKETIDRANKYATGESHSRIV